MMSMLLKAWDSLQIDTKKEFKSLFVTNALDGSEDYLVSDKLFSLIGEDMVAFRKELLSSNLKTLNEVVRNIIPPKEVKRKSNVEGSELLDCEGDEISIEEQQQEYEEIVDEDESNVSETDENTPANSSPTVSKKHVSLSNLTNDPDIKKDAEFLEKLQKIMTDGSTSKLFIPYMSQFRATYQKARRSIKKRVESKTSHMKTNTQQDQVNDTDQISVNVSPSEEVEAAQFIESNPEQLEATSNDDPPPKETPDVNQYWEISNGRDSLYGIVIQTNPLMVQYFEPTSRGDAYKLNDMKFEVFSADFVRKIKEPELIAVGRSRVNYVFDLNI